MYRLWLLLFAYVVGAIPTSYLLVRFLRDLDIRAIGSGNSGATNTGRVLGAPGFIAVLLIDVIKAYAALQICTVYSDGDPLLVMAAAAALLLGNGYSPFLAFSGGKGVATTVGIVLFLFPPLLWICYILVFLGLLSIFGRVDIASLGSAAAGPLCVWLFGLSTVTLYATIGLAAWIWFRHNSNIMILWSIYVQRGR